MRVRVGQEGSWETSLEGAVVSWRRDDSPKVESRPGQYKWASLSPMLAGAESAFKGSLESSGPWLVALGEIPGGGKFPSNCWVNWWDAFPGTCAGLSLSSPVPESQSHQLSLPCDGSTRSQTEP